MRRVFVFCVVLICAGTVNSENLTDVDEMICAPGQAMVCLETGDCYSSTPWEVSLPDFVVIDLGKKLISTTKSAAEQRTTDVSVVKSDDGMIFLQGVQRGRAFSVVIEEVTGRMTVSVSRDGLTVAAFGACTSTDV